MEKKTYLLPKTKTLSLETRGKICNPPVVVSETVPEPVYAGPDPIDLPVSELF